MCLLWFCCVSNAQQTSDVINIVDIKVTEPSCNDLTGGIIEVVVDVSLEGELVYLAERTEHIGQDTGEKNDVTSEDGIFSDCFPGCYKISIYFADNPESIVSRSVVLSQLALTGSLAIDKSDITDNYCKNANSTQVNTVIVRVTDTADHPEWFAMFDAVSGELRQFKTVGDQGIATDSISCTFKDIKPGKYFFKAGNTTNGCVIQSDRNDPVVFVDPVIVNSVTVKNVVCKGDHTGEITALVTGGVPRLNYILLNENKTLSSNTTGALSGVFKDVFSSTFHLVVKDAAACTDTIYNIKISEPETAITVSTLQTKLADCDPKKEGGIIIISAGGGMGDFLYKIDNEPYRVSNIFENLRAGTHSVIIRDAGNCELLSNVVVRSIPAPDLSASEVGTITCYNDKSGITIHATPYSPEGGNTIVAYWLDGDRYGETEHGMNNVFDHLNGDTYRLYAEDSRGCVGITTVIIAEPESQMGLGLKEVKRPYGNNKGSITIAVSGGWEGYDMVFRKIVGVNQQELMTLTNKTAGDYTFDNLDAGDYQLVILKDQRGCTDSSPLVYTLEIATGETTLQAAQIKILPNPSNDGRFIIEWSANEEHRVTLELYNAIGQLVYKTNAQIGTNSEHTMLNYSSQSRGVYLLHVPELNIRQKLVIQ